MEKPMFIRTPYNYDRRKASVESGLHCTDGSRTIQDHKEECDINTIVRRFGITGQLPTGVRAPQYGDFESVSDYHTALNSIASSNEAFDAMPAAVRDRFHNDPGEFVSFCLDENNRDEMQKLGLLTPQIQSLTQNAPTTPLSTGTPTAPSQAGGGVPVGNP